MTEPFKNWMLGLFAASLISIVAWVICKFIPWDIHVSLLESWGITMLAMSVSSGMLAYKSEV